MLCSFSMTFWVVRAAYIYIERERERVSLYLSSSRRELSSVHSWAGKGFEICCRLIHSNKVERRNNFYCECVNDAGDEFHPFFPVLGLKGAPFCCSRCIWKTPFIRYSSVTWKLCIILITFICPCFQEYIACYYLMDRWQTWGSYFLFARWVNTKNMYLEMYLSCDKIHVLELGFLHFKENLRCINLSWLPCSSMFISTECMCARVSICILHLCSIFIRLQSPAII